MLRPMPIGPIPPETARVARAAFPKGNRYLRVADELDALFTDDAFLALFCDGGIAPHTYRRGVTDPNICVIPGQQAWVLPNLMPFGQEP
jgi:hypothetical protein